MPDPEPPRTFDPAVLRAVLFKTSDGIEQVAYTVEETIAAFGAGVSAATVWRLVRQGEIPTRNTGRRYLVSGGVIVDVLGRTPDGINDPRQTIDPERRYTLPQFATLLGVPYGIAHRLTHRADAGLAPERIGTGLHLSGQVILGYLAGADEPIRHPDSNRVLRGTTAGPDRRQS